MGLKWRKDSIKAIQEKETQRMTDKTYESQLRVAAMAFCAAATTVTDAQALQMAELFPLWEDLLASGNKLGQNAMPKECWRYTNLLTRHMLARWRTPSLGRMAWTASLAPTTATRAMSIRSIEEAI